MPKKSLDVESAEEAGASVNPLVTIEFNGREFSFPRDRDDWPTGAIMAAAEENGVGIIKALLGDAQWTTLMAMPWRSVREDFFPLLNAATEECIN